MEIDPYHNHVYLSRALANVILNHHTEAQDDLNKFLAECQPDADESYNIACFYVLINEHDESIKWLEKALDMDDKLRDELINDADFDNIRDNPRFKSLLGFE